MREETSRVCADVNIDLVQNGTDASLDRR